MALTSPPTAACPLFLAGARVSTEQRLEVLNPYNGETVGEVSVAGWAEFDEALNRAKAAFAQWRDCPAHRRFDILAGAAQRVNQMREGLARLIALEAGKPIRDARVEVDRAVFTLQYAAEEARRPEEELVPMDLAPKGEGRVGLLQRFPLGPVLGITPFNTPLNLVVHKVGPALASGNPILIKPSSLTPLVALQLAEILDQAGAPPGVVSVLPALAEIAERAVQDDRVAMFSFTGSSTVGWRLRSLAPRKRATLELGGNSAVIVHHDADLLLAARGCVYGGFGYAGQSCTSVQRVFVHERVWESFLAEVLPLTAQLRVGDPLDEATDVGPMITLAAAEATEGRIRAAVARGARVLAGGSRDGALVEPTILTDVADDMAVMCEELFAPVINLMPYRDFDEAIARVNASPYGLQAGVFTRDVERIFRAFRLVEVGGLMANEVSAFRVDHMPYGGVKDSGVGREGIRYAIAEMTEQRLLVLTHRLPPVV